MEALDLNPPFIILLRGTQIYFYTLKKRGSNYFKTNPTMIMLGVYALQDSGPPTNHTLHIQAPCSCLPRG